MIETTQKLLPNGSLTWFEIPTGDIERAAAFFCAVLASPLIDVSHDEPMYMFPSFGGEVAGAIVQRTGPLACVPALRVPWSTCGLRAR